MKRDYVFLLGAPRSGTTWLQIMLARHPEIATCQETHLFSGFLSSLQRSWRHHENDRRGIGLQAAISREQFIALQRHFALSVLNAVGDNAIILEKTPAHITVLDDIREVLPEARFIHIIRDPRAVAASLAAAGRDWGRNWASTSAVHNARRWTSNVSDGLRLRQEDPGKYFEVHYEALLEDTAGNLGAIFGWFGIDASMALCRQVAEDNRIGNLRNARSQAAWDLAKEPRGFFRKGRSDGWKEDLSRGEVAVVEAVAGPLMEHLGYQRTTPGMTWLQGLGIRAREGLARRLTNLALKIQ